MAADEAAEGAISGVYVCDVHPEITREDLWQVFGHYGEIVSIEPLTAGAGAFHICFTQANLTAADEACGILNYSSLRGQTCRCYSAASLEIIRRTMDTGQRLVIEQLDPAVESCGLHEACSLFGQVLDCKVEPDAERGTCNVGFAHFRNEEDAAKATKFLGGMQIGNLVVQVRLFEPADVTLFTGCGYAPSGDSIEAPSPPETEEDQEVPSTPEQMYGAVLQRFRSLEYHAVEVFDDLASKVKRLKTLIQLYDPTHETQMVIIAEPANVKIVSQVLGECLEDCDFGVLQPSLADHDKGLVFEGYATGNLYVVVMSSDVSTRNGFDLEVPASVLVHFDCPSTFPLYLRRVFKLADGNTRVHSFFSPATDQKWAEPLLMAMEEAGHEIPSGLVELWSSGTDGEQNGPNDQRK